MKITDSLRERVVNGWKNYLTTNQEKAEEVVCFFDSKSFIDFLAKFEPDISKYSVTQDMQKFLEDKTFGQPVVIVWNKFGHKIGDGKGYVFNSCKLMQDEKMKKKNLFEVVLWGSRQEFLLREK